MSKTLSKQEIETREAFVAEYISCRDPKLACIKIGFLEPYAEDWGVKFMAEKFVKELIAEAEARETKERKQRKETYRAWMEREANNYDDRASHSARVNAIAHLMKLEKMVDTHESGGVMIVPALTSPEKWAEQAAEAQAKLKQEVKE